MSDANDLQVLVGKILSDEKFGEALAKNPEQALKDVGIDPTIDLIEALKGVDAASLKSLAAAFGKNQAAV
jgi:hypothetical protein